MDNLYLNLGLLVLGTLILIYAAKYLVEGLIGLAARLVVTPFILAMLIISIDLEVFGPAVIGSYQNLTALSYGSILGTVAFLILLALGSAAAIYPIEHPDFPLKYILFLGVILGFVFLLSVDGVIGRTDGVLALLAYFAYLVYLVRDLKRSRAAQAEIAEAEAEVGKIIKEPVWLFPLMLLGGLVGLVIGSTLVIQGVRVCLATWGLAETLVGVTLLAIAANSVELVEAIIPARQGHSEVVIGNVTGSCVFQLLFTLGVAALIRPLRVEPVALSFVFPAVTLSWLLLVIVVWQGRTPRWAGVSLTVLYILFVTGTVILGLRI